MILRKPYLYNGNLKQLVLLIGMLFPSLLFFAQQPFDGYFKMRGKSMFIDLPRESSFKSIDSFAKQFSLTDIGLYQLVTTGKADSLEKSGWSIDRSNSNRYRLSKRLEAINNLKNPEGRIIFSAVPTPDTWRIVGGNRVIYGINQFRTKPSVIQENDIISFFLDGYRSAKSVRLAGSFTNWQFGSFPMAKTDNGWVVKVKLNPGQYFYKFIIDDHRWITDPANALEEDDGRGNINSVVFVINKVFYLENHRDAKRVYLAGTFNNWNRESIPLRKKEKGWAVDMFLENGTHEYEYWIDGKRLDIGVASDSSFSGKSVIALGDRYKFKLKGFKEARNVVVSGNFVDWDPGKLKMNRTSDGWELEFALGTGNFQYKFIVDGEWIVDPANPLVVDDGKGHSNSFMVIGANYQFRLKGFESARHVFLTGDFADWCVNCVPMKWNGSEWVGSVYLAKGKHLYKFIVDGNWILDPSNRSWEGGNSKTGNSVLWKD